MAFALRQGAFEFRGCERVCMRKTRLQLKSAARFGVCVLLSALLACPGVVTPAFAEGEDATGGSSSTTETTNPSQSGDDQGSQDENVDSGDDASATDTDTANDKASSSSEKKKSSSKDKKKSSKSKKKKSSEDDVVSSAQLATAKQAIAQMESLTTDLETAYENLEEVKTKTKKLKKRVKKIKEETKDVEAQLVEARDTLNIWVKESYINGAVRYLSVMLGATSFEDFAGRLKLLEIIMDNEADALQRVKDLQENLDSKKKELVENLAEQKKLKKQATDEAKTVQENLTTQAKYFQALPKKVKKKVLAYDGVRNTINKAAGADGITVKTGSHPKVVTEALKYLGVKYVWGGETPSGFDCSGLTMYCYAKLGISLTHFARTQYDEGVHVAYTALMPGDLVFFGSDVESIHHVGIYMGDDKFIHAPQTGDVVKISTLSSRSDYVGACRPQ